MSNIPVSVIIMTKNEELNIQKCIDSLSGVDEIFVVDSNSEDCTCEIARKMGATIVNFTWNRKYPKKKQWCLENLPFNNDWVLYVDADEESTEKLLKEIDAVIREDNGSIKGYFVKYRYVFLGKILKHGHKVQKLILLNRNFSKFVDVDDLEVNNMWEVEGHYQPKVDGKVKRLKSYMIHNDHSSLYEYFSRHNRYSDWESSMRIRSNGRREEETQTFGRMILKRVYSIIPFTGALAFVHSYILHLGMLDGRAGFHYAIARAFYYWQINIKVKEFKK